LNVGSTMETSRASELGWVGFSMATTGDEPVLLARSDPRDAPSQLCRRVVLLARCSPALATRNLPPFLLKSPAKNKGFLARRPATATLWVQALASGATAIWRCGPRFPPQLEGESKSDGGSYFSSSSKLA